MKKALAMFLATSDSLCCSRLPRLARWQVELVVVESGYTRDVESMKFRWRRTALAAAEWTEGRLPPPALNHYFLHVRRIEHP